MKPIFIEARDLPDAWFQCIYRIFETEGIHEYPTIAMFLLKTNGHVLYHLTPLTIRDEDFIFHC
jgi:hypothetical protein